MRIGPKRHAATLALAVGLAAPPAALAQRVLPERIEGFRLYDEGQYREAIPYLDDVLNRRPRDVGAHVKRGHIHVRLNEPELAIPHFTAAIGLAPGNPSSYVDRGLALIMLGRDSDALRDLTLATTIYGSWGQNSNSPGCARAHRGLGQVYHRLGRNTEAIAEYDSAIRIDPNNAGAYKDRGGVYVRMAQYQRAIEDLDMAIRLEPRRSTAYLNRGAAYNNLGQPERALEDLTEAIRLDPQDSRAYTNSGLAHFALGDYNRAAADLSEAIRLDPLNPLLRMNRAGANARMGRLEDAILDLDEVLRVDPRSASAYAARGAARDGLGQPEEALRDFDMAIGLRPTDAALLCRRGNARRALGDWAGAVADFSGALQIDPKHAEAYILRGWSRLGADRDGADADARAYLDLAGGRDRYSPYMAILGSLAARRAGHAGEAERFLDDGLASTRPSMWPAPLLRYLKRRRPAPEDVVAAAADASQKAEAHVLLGLDQLLSGDRPTAIDFLQRALELGIGRSIATDVARATLTRLQ